jgi:hypothetical protein
MVLSRLLLLRGMCSVHVTCVRRSGMCAFMDQCAVVGVCAHGVTVFVCTCVCMCVCVCHCVCVCVCMYVCMCDVCTHL